MALTFIKKRNRKLTRPRVMGVYKIVSPSGRVYVGSSKDIYRRWNNYRKNCNKDQRLVYRSILKYGAEAHSFEIIEIVVDETQLFERERYWGLKLNSLSEFGGLNLILPGAGEMPRVYSKETIARFSEIGKGRKYSPETIEKFRKAKQGKSVFEGRRHSEESKLKISEKKKGVIVGALHGRSRLVLDHETGIFYDSISQAASSLSIRAKTLMERIRLRNYQRLKIV